jgi:hypothetical protein
MISFCQVTLESHKDDTMICEFVAVTFNAQVETEFFTTSGVKPPCWSFPCSEPGARTSVCNSVISRKANNLLLIIFHDSGATANIVILPFSLSSTLPFPSPLFPFPFFPPSLPPLISFTSLFFRSPQSFPFLLSYPSLTSPF